MARAGKPSSQPGNREDLYSRLAIYGYVEIDELEPALNILLNDTNCIILSYKEFKENIGRGGRLSQLIQALHQL